MKLESSTIDVKLSGQICLEHFTLTHMHTWINDEWLLYSFENWSKDLFPKLLGEADSNTTKLLVTDHSFRTFAKFSEKLKFFTPWHARLSAYQGVRNACFSENFAYLLKE